MTASNPDAEALADLFDHCPAMLFVAEPSGAIVRSSAALGGLLGPAARAGMTLGESVHPADLGPFEAAWRRLIDEGGPVEIALRLRAEGGDYRPTSIRARRSPRSGEIHGEVREHQSSTALGSERAEKLLRVMLDSIPITMWVLDPQGIITFTDGKGMALVGNYPGKYVGMSVFDLIAGSPNVVYVKRALEGTPAHTSGEALGIPWENWYTPVRDERGELEAVVGVSMSLVEAKRTERELRERIAMIERQQQVIRAMSTPIIEIWDKVLTLPMVGVVDSARAAEVMENLLAHVSRKGSRFAILDLTGVDAVDTSTASHLLKLVQALRLLGTEGIITGIQPSVAETMVALGVDMESITTLAKLRDGLRYCVKRLREEKAT